MEFSKSGDRRGPGSAYSALIGLGAGTTVPRTLRRSAYRAFARAVGVNLAEAELPLAAYASFGEFFARRLRDGARPVDPAADAVLVPCDGVVAACGHARDGELVQAKGRSYRLEELVADESFAERLRDGPYATIYLSPRDYHRVHAPVDAEIVGYDYLPGALWPVNPRIAARRDRLLSRNERVVIRMRSRFGELAFVMVGASGVGNMRLAFVDGSGDGGLESVRWRGARERRRVELSGIRVRRGDELGAFRLGSTVVMVFELGGVALAGEVGQAVRFGERFGSTVASGGSAA